MFERYPLHQLFSYIKKGSLTARDLFLSEMHCLNACYYLDSKEYLIAISELAKSLRIEEIVILLNISTIKEFASEANNILAKDQKNIDALTVWMHYEGYPDQLTNYQYTIEQCTQCINLYPQDAFFYMRRGCLLCFNKEHEKAVNDFDTAITLDSDFSLYYLRATAHRNIHDNIKKAIPDYLHYLKIAPSDDRKIPNAHYGLAECYISLSQYEDAKAHTDLAKIAEDNLLPFFPKLEDGGVKKAVLTFFERTEKHTQRLNNMKQSIYNPHEINNQCVHCGKIATTRCSRCKVVYYCSVQCQKTNYNKHKIKCNKS